MKPYEISDSGQCNTCNTKISDKDHKIKCSHCEVFYHATCSHTDPIGRISYLKAFHHLTIKPNFTWSCDVCLTLAEQNKVGTLSEQISTLRLAVEKLSRERCINDLKKLVQEEFTLLTENVTTDVRVRLTETKTELNKKFEDLQCKLLENLPATENVANDLTNPWQNTRKVNQIKSALLVKPSDGQPIDIKKVKDAAVDNGIPLDSVVVSTGGETFVNFPNEDSRKKLEPILANIEPQSEVIVLKSKLPSIALLSVTEEHSPQDITRMIKQQNQVIGSLIDTGSHMSVVYTKKPTEGQKFHQVVLRVSPEIRRAIKSNNMKIHMSDRVHKVVDRFHIKRCNTCHQFGHYSDKCDNPRVCGYCGENSHDSKDCPIKDGGHAHFKCNNCEKQSLNPVGHSTFWSKCPAYLDQQNKYKRTIGYNYDESN